MSARSPFPVRLTQGWVRLYTRGLPPDLREERRAELESDIWEQTNTPNSKDASVLVRCLLGMPADLSWRLEHARPGAALIQLAAAGMTRVEVAAHWLGQKGLPGLTLLAAWLYLLAGVFMLLTLPVSRNPDLGAVAVLGIWCAVAGGLMWWGHNSFPERPRRGAFLVIVGCLPIGVALYMTVVIPFLTVAVCANAVQRARNARAGPSSASDIAKRKISSYYLHRLARPTHLPAVGDRAMFPRVLDLGVSLIHPAQALAPTVSRRRYVLTGAAIGLSLGILARIWMRTITSDDPKFTVGGTGLILIVFTGLGVLTGLSLAWRRFGTTRRMLLVRGAAWAPFLLMGPFMLLFLPGLQLALVRTHAGWRRWLRRTLTWSAYPLLAFLVLIFLNAERGPGLVSASIYLLLAFALYFTNRVALTIPRRDGEAPSSPTPGRSTPTRRNYSGAGMRPV